jgi:hypothetical protein
MRSCSRTVRLAAILLGWTAVPLAAQDPPVRPYAHGGVGIGRFVLQCAGCGSPQTALVPSASFGLSFTRVGLDLGLHALGWTHIGDRYTVITLGTTVRPRAIPIFFGAGAGLSVRQYPEVCSSCPGTPGTPVLLRGSSTDPALMAQLGVRIAVAYRVAIEPFAQYSRLTGIGLPQERGDHLTVGIRIDGRE